jgi:cellulose synthase/poly-beta-1,6-N-acetylglucosamine synthase-like glycosyltransferase
MDTLITGVSAAGTTPARPGSGIVVVIPARDEGAGLAAALRSVERQTQLPDRLIVVVNNSTDDTEQVARNYVRSQRRLPVDVLVMPGFNRYKKAGALNYGIRHIVRDGALPTAVSYLLVMDGDTELDPHFLKRAQRIVARDDALGGVSAACLGKPMKGETPWQNLLLLLQRVEYGRFSATRLRRNVHTMSGAGSFYRAQALNDLLARRPDIFEERESNLVEDYETTLALKTCGWRVTCNQKCVAYTDLMPTLRMLIAQRVRWLRGTFDEWRRYGWCKATRLSILSTGVCTAGIIYTAVWLSLSIRPLIAQVGRVDHQSLILVFFWSAYQGVSVRHMGWKIVLFEMILVPEIIFSLLRSYWLVKSIFASYRRKKSQWS